MCQSINLQKKTSMRGKQNKKDNSYWYDDELQCYVFYWEDREKVMLIDKCDFAEVNKYRWKYFERNDGYIRVLARVDGVEMSLLRFLGLSGYDHKDRNPLNNLRTNLRPATFNANAQNRNKQKNNTSGVIGVVWHKQSQKWESRINITGKRKTLGRFKDIIDAIKSRLMAEMQYYGEFAPQKHLYEQYGIVDTYNS